MWCKVVMYHYVRKYNEDLPNLKFLDVSSFEKQLDFLWRKFGFISRFDREDFLDWKIKSINWIILTFDDWLIDHYEYVLPILKKKNLWWIFFISSWPLKNRKVLNVHKIHYLLWKYDADLLYNIYVDILLKLSITISNEEINYINEYDYQNLNYKVLSIKKINYLFTIDIQNEILESFFKILHEDEEKLFDVFYMNRTHIIELIKEWNVIWWHTENHIMLSKCLNDGLKNEIKTSNQYLEKEFNIKITSFACPYWLKSSYNENTLLYLKNNWIRNNFIVCSEQFNSIDSSYQIPRYDCTSLKYWEIF